MDRIEKLIIDFKNFVVKQPINYYDYNKVLITSHSTRIEGSTLSIGEVYALIEDGITPKKAFVHSMMTLDYYNALSYVIDQSSRRTPISVEQIKHIASLVMKRTAQIVSRESVKADAAKRDFRNYLSTGDIVFTSYDKVPEKMKELVDKINEELEKGDNLNICQKLELSFFIHCELINIQPFIDGNGRTARLLMNYIQNYFSLPLSIVYAEDNREYYPVLRKVRDTNDIQPFYDFMFFQYQKFLNEEIEKANEADNSKSITFKLNK